jgi:hypothetical protein
MMILAAIISSATIGVSATIEELKEFEGFDEIVVFERFDEF